MEYEVIDRIETLFTIEQDKQMLNDWAKKGWKLVSVVRVPVRGYSNLYSNRYYLERKMNIN